MATKSAKKRDKRTAGGLKPFASRRTVNVVIETPRGARNKFRFDEKLGMFRLSKVLPAGAAFPYDFGFIPGTRAEDGDPLDVLVLMDQSAFPGCLVESRLIGVIEAEQVEDGKPVRNDRVVAVAEKAHDYRDLKSVRDMNNDLLRDLEHFFKSYNEVRNVEFRLLGTRGPQRAIRVVKTSMEQPGASARKRQQAK